MKYELRRMRKLSPGLTVNNSGGAGKGSVILMGEEAGLGITRVPVFFD